MPEASHGAQSVEIVVLVTHTWDGFVLGLSLTASEGHVSYHAVHRMPGLEDINAFGVIPWPVLRGFDALCLGHFVVESHVSYVLLKIRIIPERILQGDCPVCVRERNIPF